MNRRMIDGYSLAMSDVYAAVTDRLLVNLARHFKFITESGQIPGAWEYQIRKLAEMDAVTRESEQIILDSLGGADEALRQLLESVITDSLKDAEEPLKKAAERGLTYGTGFTSPQLAPNQTQAFQMYYQQSADKLNLVNTVMLDSTKQAYRNTVADISSKITNTQTILNAAAGQTITGVESFNRVLHDSVRKMVDNGLTGFIDHGGHHWSPEAYVAMDMRTTMTNTGRESVWEQSEQVGVDLYQVSWHDGARPLCYPWQGKVISRNGWTGEVEDDEGNKVTVHAESEIPSFKYGGGLFGVNCGHYPIPFIPGFSRIRKPRQNAEENAKEYAESQQQRALERNLREEKRELAVMKAQGATDEEIRAQKQRVKNASSDLDDFCDATGRARQRQRESTPINASFPDGYKQTYYERGIKRRDPSSANVASNATQNALNRDTFKNVQGVTDQFRTGMADALMQSSNQEVKDVFVKYADELVCKQNNKKSGAFFRSTSGGIYMNIVNDAAGSSYQTPYEVAFHEFGHMIDWLAGGKNNWDYLSNQPVNGKRLLDVIKSDFQDFKKSLGVSKAADVIPILKAENMDERTKGNISDILEKCTGVSYPLGIGHGASYHKREGATEKEFFAEVLDSAAVNQASYDQLKRLFPNAVDMVWKLIKGVI